MSIVAIVPVRAGSQRVPKKGFRPFGDTTLIDLKLSILTQVDKIDEIIVTTDSSEVLEIADKYGVTKHTRDPYFASSECTGSEIFEYFTTITSAEHIIYTPPTAPFLTKEHYEACIEAYSKQDCDSVATVAAVKHHMWLDGKPINYEIESSPNSQDLPDIFRITYGICLNSRSGMAKHKNVVGRNPHFICLDEIEAFDIDTLLDFEFAEYVHKSKVEPASE
tara:strand:+ start:8065 stop:8727 length:663 start_codon:yes stop_codon:yes gene_type:complete